MEPAGGDVQALRPDLINVTASDGTTLAAWRQGRADGPPLLLVHGYPDTHMVWDPVVAHLESDFRILRYDVRGAGASGAPRATSAYRLEQLAADMKAVIEALSPDRPVHLVGHDWGSIQGWEAVCDERLRGRIARFTSISGPSLDHVGRWMRARAPADRRRQLMRSWYIGALQLPGFPTLMWRTGLARRWSAILEKQEGAAPPESPTRARDGARGAALYRANMPQRIGVPRERSTDIPVQLVVLRRDRFVTPQLLDGIESIAPRLSRVELDAGHWAIVSRASEIAHLIRGFAR